MDLQPVFHCSKLFLHVCCLSESESESSRALLQVCSEIRSMNLNARELMHKLASYYQSSRQIYLQEALCYILPELWLKKKNKNIFTFKKIYKARPRKTPITTISV